MIKLSHKVAALPLAFVMATMMVISVSAVQEASQNGFTPFKEELKPVNSSSVPPSTSVESNGVEASHLEQPVITRSSPAQENHFATRLATVPLRPRGRHEYGENHDYDEDYLLHRVPGGRVHHPARHNHHHHRHHHHHHPSLGDERLVQEFMDNERDLERIEREQDPLRRLALYLEREKKLVHFLRDRLANSETEMERLTERLLELEREVESARAGALAGGESSAGGMAGSYRELYALYETAREGERESRERLEEALRRISELEGGRHHELVHRRLYDDDDYDGDDFDCDDDEDDEGCYERRAEYQRHLPRTNKGHLGRFGPALSLEKIGQVLLREMPVHERLENRCEKLYMAYNHPGQVDRQVVSTVARLELPPVENEIFAPAAVFFDDLYEFQSRLAATNNGQPSKRTRRVIAELDKCLLLRRVGPQSHQQQHVVPPLGSLSVGSNPLNEPEVVHSGGQEIPVDQIRGPTGRPTPYFGQPTPFINGVPQPQPQHPTVHSVPVTVGPWHRSGPQPVPVHVVNHSQRTRHVVPVTDSSNQHHSPQPPMNPQNTFGRWQYAVGPPRKPAPVAHGQPGLLRAHASVSTPSGLTHDEQEQLKHRFPKIPDIPSMGSHSFF